MENTEEMEEGRVVKRGKLSTLFTSPDDSLTPGPTSTSGAAGLDKGGVMNAPSGSDQSDEVVGPSTTPLTDHNSSTNTPIGPSPHPQDRTVEAKKEERSEDTDIFKQSLFQNNTSLKPISSSSPESFESEREILPLDQLDLRFVPNSWEDIVRVDISTIPGAGRGLFAVRNLPAWTVLGFYFGVPDFEDDFDRDKDGIGIASSYSIRYRHTVLDATDAFGQPFDQPGISPIYCPWHYMNEDTNRGNVLFVEGACVNMVICMSTRRIGSGEELFVYYGTDVERDEWQAHPADSQSKNAATQGEEKEDIRMEEAKVEAEGQEVKMEGIKLEGKVEETKAKKEPISATSVDDSPVSLVDGVKHQVSFVLSSPAKEAGDASSPMTIPPSSSYDEVVREAGKNPAGSEPVSKPRQSEGNGDDC
ncbi:hypothetical protein BJ684DRAFT_20928 [Piptocephalis cylindrospora]|uniref:SET domain-containing protein n=1 Tax=Piptocephalis cylindrospora TaxID=1907219 RepID=A0A4P9Y3Z1_9FUNG|nr:hypothetical protein BJ684DRAFT_20928 [Piptocephalis cylindrospora]|eukprot:RKP12540.1 hypothetical protein BJ684DRAFT_20928 [Piptocephalis cylindrospora]